MSVAQGDEDTASELDDINSGMLSSHMIPCVRVCVWVSMSFTHMHILYDRTTTAAVSRAACSR